MKIMITGGLGFIGTTFTKFILDTTPHTVALIDKMTYAFNHYWWEPENHLPYGPRFHLYQDDVFNANTNDWPTDVDVIVHFAAETHVDNSIGKAAPFIHTNVVGTHKLLEYAKAINVGKFVYISTDEVYGCTSLRSKRLFKETDKLCPNNPYSATKAAGEHLCMSYWHTFGVPIVITRSCNNYGPFQHREKLIPTVIRSIKEGKPIPVYGKGKNIREWIPVEENSRAILEVFYHGQVGAAYNIGSGWRLKNLDLIKLITRYLGKGKIQFVTDRLGHDLRYALDASKIESELGFKCLNEYECERYLENTIDWYWRRKYYD